MTLKWGMRLLRDVGQSEAGLITATLGSGDQQASLTTSTEQVQQQVLAVSTPVPEVKKKKKRQKSKLCIQYGLCTNHGPRSLQQTYECQDPTLSRRKNKNKT